MSTKHLRPEWTERLRGAASAHASHAALVAGTRARVGHRSFTSHPSVTRRAAATRRHVEAIRARLGTRGGPA